MKLLFDQHLSHKLVRRLADLFPDSTQTRLLGLGTTDDKVIWEYAKQHGCTVVTLDADYYDISLLRGHPPKLIWLRCGNQKTAFLEKMLRDHYTKIVEFEKDTTTGCLDIY
jgi:predicted nuclease of predicted toxin-antitoxin system